MIIDSGAVVERIMQNFQRSRVQCHTGGHLVHLHTIEIQNFRNTAHSSIAIKLLQTDLFRLGMVLIIINCGISEF